MHLSVHSLQKTLFEGDVASVSLPTPLGEMTVLDHHIPLVSIVSPGEIRYTLLDDSSASLGTGEVTKVLPFSGGILEIRPESKVVVLANPL